MFIVNIFPLNLRTLFLRFMYKARLTTAFYKPTLRIPF